jgi:hypothetical protein
MAEFPKLDVTRGKLRRAERDIIASLGFAVLNAVAVFGIGNCPDQASETRVFCRTFNYERCPVDNFNNPRLNQAVAEDQLLPSASFLPESISHRSPKNLEIYQQQTATLCTLRQKPPRKVSDPKAGG